MFYHHLINLPEDSLAFEITKVQEVLGYPGLVQECKSLIVKYNLPPAHLFSKGQWRTMVKRATRKMNEEEILNKMKKYKKLDYEKYAKESFEVKHYLKVLNIPDSRMKFAIRSKMTQTVQMNYKSEKKYIINRWRCMSCDELDTQEHLLSCEGYKHLRAGKDLERDKDLVLYFRSIVKQRLEAGLLMSALAQVQSVLGARFR